MTVLRQVSERAGACATMYYLLLKVVTQHFAERGAERKWQMETFVALQQWPFQSCTDLDKHKAPLKATGE